jgi:hypothetical protein
VSSNVHNLIPPRPEGQGDANETLSAPLATPSTSQPVPSVESKPLEDRTSVKPTPERGARVIYEPSFFRRAPGGDSDGDFLAPDRRALEPGRHRSELPVLGSYRVIPWLPLSWKGLLFGLGVIVGIAGGVAFWAAPPRSTAAARALALPSGVAHRTTDDGAWLAATAQPISVRFSEGVQFVLESGARGRLSRFPGEGAVLTLELGTLVGQVPATSHDTRRSWDVNAGPFDVAVDVGANGKGAEYTLRWDPAAQRLNLTVRDGQLTLTGPVVDRRVIPGGQGVEISLERGSIVDSSNK